MPKICYIDKIFSPSHQSIIAQANAICNEYTAQGFTLTLRQLYYQFVARALIPNRDTEYKRLGSIVNDARMAGLIDWNHIVDRTREVEDNEHWGSPEDIMRSCESSYAIDKWLGQSVRPYVMIEKDALLGVIEGVCGELDIPYFACRGFASATSVRDLALRMIRDHRDSRDPIVLYFGDHDPSGIDMTRDVTERLQVFVEHHGYTRPEVKRLALNMAQVDEYNPPPNPAKTTDARYAGYAAEYGDESWELDALEPAVIAGLIRTEVEAMRDEDAWQTAIDEEGEAKLALGAIAQKWDRVAALVIDPDRWSNFEMLVDDGEL